MTASAFRSHLLGCWLIVHVRGRLDRQAADALHRRLCDLFPVQPLLVADLTRANLVIDECLPVFLALQHQAELYGGACVLVSACRRTRNALKHADPRGRLVVCATIRDLPCLPGEREALPEGDDCLSA